MMMISYAQNREDVLLRRVFGDASRRFYIDVGAQDPLEGSVTKWFYDQGWRGINIEPQSRYYQRLCQERPGDVTLQAVLSSHSGAMTLYELPDYPGLATVDDRQLAKLKSLQPKVITSRLPALTLAEVCERHVHEEIAFLKVDVEGHEKAVFEGADWKRFRPVVVLAEATEVCSSVRSQDAWDEVLLEADYVYATFDGLNAYYVRKEDAHLVEKLKVPANVLDEFVPYLTKECLEQNFGIGPRGLKIAQCLTSVRRWLFPRLRLSKLTRA